jgi:DNA adenine methylase
MNPDLICTYQVIQNEVEELILQLENLSSDLSKEKYYEIRAQQDLTGIERAARFIYLNKTGFNGLWRVNSKGHYNVPWGQLKNPTIFEPDTLRSVAQRLVGTTITHTEFSTAVDATVAGDVVYFDPPYIPLSTSSSFSQYAMADFGLHEQKELAETIENLKSKSVEVILSNSDTELSREIFGNVMNLYQIDASRAIAAKASSRGSVKEIIGTTKRISEDLLSPEMTPISFC